MTSKSWLVWLSLILLPSGCASFQLAGQVQSGRQALLANSPEEALPYFQQAAQSNPSYIYQYQLFREGIWTYVGRAQYTSRKFQDARQSFERAVSIYNDDYLARLYLGLTLARSGDQSRALKEIQTGLKGLYDFLEYMNYSRPFTAYWDPLRQIRNEIDKDLGVISGRDIDWPKLIESAEWVGNEMDKEVERVRRDEDRYFRDRDFRRRHGTSVGVGVGF